MKIAPAVLPAHDGVGNAPDSSSSSSSDSSASTLTSDTVSVNNNNLSTNRYDDDDDEEEDVCRICRNPGDADNPLRYPCACSGSIKFVPQDCLLQGSTTATLATAREGGSIGRGNTEVGSYNALLKSTLPEEYKYYKAEEETFESSHNIFRLAFPRGFAWEVISVHSGPPVISYKFRHWGYFEGPFKGHAPTGEMVEFYGMGILKVDESLRAEDVEIYYDPADLISNLLKGSLISEQQHHATDTSAANTSSCPFQKGA